MHCVCVFVLWMGINTINTDVVVTFVIMKIILKNADKMCSYIYILLTNYFKFYIFGC